ncbi:tRNA pseudouridine(54/55) synthase Pus10 [soil metagenome]
MKRNFLYKLCNWCLKRQNVKSYSPNKIVEDCQICHGFESQIEKICKNVLQVTKDYRYDTFQIGLTLDHSFYDNEDKFRSRFRIRGKENIKTSILRDIRKKFSKLSNKRVDSSSPEITINLQIGKKFETIVNMSSKTMVLSGRYTKTKRLKVTSKDSRNGDRLDLNQHHIENVLKRKLSNLLLSDSITYWPLGKEEPRSLVLGNGRPFYVSIKNSKIFNLKENFSIPSSGLVFNIKDRLPTYPAAPPFYIKKVKALVSVSEKIVTLDSDFIQNTGIKLVEFVTQRGKNWKFVYDMQVKLKSPRKFELTMICDNGFPVREFVEGRGSASTCLSDLIHKECSCDYFDIMNIVSEDDCQVSE